MIIHICNRCGHRQEYESVGATKDDPHGQRCPPGGTLCEGCESVLTELNAAIEEFRVKCLDDFRANNAIPGTKHLIDIFNKERPHCTCNELQTSGETSCPIHSEDATVAPV